MSLWKWGKAKEARRETVPVPEGASLEEMLDRLGLTRDAFSLLYARWIEERLDGRNVRFVEYGGLAFEDSGGKEMTAYVDNAWNQCQQGDEARSVIVERYLAGLKATFQKEDFEKNQIVAIVRASEYMAFHPRDTSVPAEHLAADLWVIYAIDRPETTMTMSLEDLKSSGVAAGELRALAVENLVALLPAIECHGDGPWFLVTAGPDYVASVLLFDFVWEQLVERVEGDLVAVAPSRDVLLFTGSGSLDGLQEIRQRAREVVATGHHIVSDTLLRRVEGRWVNFD